MKPPTSREHWDAVYSSRTAQDVSWYSPDYATSLRLLAGAPGSVLDIGAGAGRLVDLLLDEGRTDVTLLDTSTAALDAVRDRLLPTGPTTRRDGHLVDFIGADITSWQPARTYDAWHDRAVLHFLRQPADQQQYARTAARAVRPGGRAVIGVFSSDGPKTCSGLEVQRYDAEDLDGLFGPCGFTLEHAETHTHVTPWETEQSFTWVRLVRTR